MIALARHPLEANVVAPPEMTPNLSFGRGGTNIAEGQCAMLPLTVNQLSLLRLSWIRENSPWLEPVATCLA